MLELIEAENEVMNRKYCNYFLGCIFIVVHSGIEFNRDLGFVVPNFR